MYKKVLCGLDIGTNSVGWCLTDENNNIIKKNGKSLWGVRMFEEAKACAERRSHRCDRRRLTRRKERIDLLQELFKDEIKKIDSSFFYRLDNSFCVKEDRTIPFEYTLFNDKNFSDKDYFKKYPTIYHLRNHLIKSTQKEDIRLIYLALHHMIKYRGNFLNESTNFKVSNIDDANKYFNSLINEITDEDGVVLYEISYNQNIFNQLLELNNNESRISVLKEKYCEILIKNDTNKYLKNAIIPLMVGSKVQLKKCLPNIDDDCEIKDLCVKDEKFDDNIAYLLSAYQENENYINAFIECKNIYQFFLIGKLLNGSSYLSEAMVKKYNLHKDQLKKLKKFVKDNYKEKYNSIFRDLDKNNYVNYIGSNITKNIKNNISHISNDVFYSFLKKELNIDKYKITEENKNDYISEILIDMESNNYLPRINSTDNGVFPYQLNLMEMQIILENQSKFYPFLLTKDDYGTTIDKIISILKFKIPYYIGPLVMPKGNDEYSKFSWIKRTEEKIYPWNFDKIVNKNESAKVFIQRMLTKCSYLPTEYCLPKDSLIFSYFNVLQVLNKTLINGSEISINDKLNIIHELFMKKRKVTKKKLIEYIKAKRGEDCTISTSNNKEIEEINANMASYYDFSNIFGEEFIKNNVDLIEKIILDIVIFEDKSILFDRLKNIYKLPDDKIKLIKGLTYSKYSNISKTLLTDIKYFDENGEIKKSIIKIMEETNQNLQEVIFNEKYNFQTLIDQYNKQNMPNGKINNIENYVKELGTISPGMKRPLIQAFKICEELEKIVGQPINEYYVECTRSNKQEKKRKNSRLQNLKNLYKEAEQTLKDDPNYQRALKELNNCEESKFQSDKYYLYFSQLGKCAYSGELIDISELFNTDKYDIDHIIPQSMIKDDSLENRVLVKQELNRSKSDQYPIPQSILFKGNYRQAYKYYELLYKAKLIGNKKFNNLTRFVELPEEELSSFVNRQLVSTNQAVKGLISAIKYFKETDTFKPKIIFSKGEIVSDFRKEFDIVKSRNVNNFHHAHDAYLNIVVGRTVETYFSPYLQNKETLQRMHANKLTTNPINIFKNKDNKKKNIFDKQGNLVWDYQNSISIINKNIFNRFDILTTTRTYYGTNLLKKVTVYKKGEGNIPVKTSNCLSDVSKYGGFTGYAFGSYCLIKVKNEFIIIAIPTMYKNNINEYLHKSNYNDYEIIINNLKINTVLTSSNKKYAITGKTGDSYVLMNLKERIFDKNGIKTMKKIEKVISKLTEKRVSVTGKETIDEINNYFSLKNNTDLVVSPTANNKANEIILTNDELISLYNYFIELFSKEIYSYSASISISNSLLNNKDIFNKLSIFGKIKLLFNLCDFLKCNERKLIDLSLIGLSKQSGTILISKKVSNCSIIYESITGFYRKVAYKID